MPTFHYNLDTDTISLQAFDPGTAEYSAPMGARPVTVVFETGDGSTGSNVLLVDKIVGLVLRDSKDVNNKVAGPFILTQGANAAAGFSGAVNTDTTPLRNLLGVDKVKAENNDAYPCVAAIYYAPVSGGLPTESNQFQWAVEPPINRTGEPPTDIVEQWASPAQLSAAIAQAASAQPSLPTPTADGQFLLGNVNRTVFWTGLPANTPLVTSGILTVGGASTLNGGLSVSGATLLTGAVTVVGAANVSGAVTAASFAGVGSALTSLNASNLTSGTVALARLPTDIPVSSVTGAAALTGATFTGAVTLPSGSTVAGYASLAGAAFTGVVTFASAVTLPAGSTVSGYAPLASPAFTGTPTAPRFTANAFGITDLMDVVNGSGEFIGKALNLTSTTGAYAYVNGPLTAKGGVFSTTGFGVWNIAGPSSQPDLGPTVPSLTAIYDLLQSYGLCVTH